MRSTRILLTTRLGSNGSEQVRVTSVQDGEDTNSEELTSGRSQGDVGSLEVVDRSLGQHGVVFEFRLSERWGVGRDEDQLGLARSHGLERGLGAGQNEEDEGQSVALHSELSSLWIANSP